MPHNVLLDMKNGKKKRHAHATDAEEQKSKDEEYVF
jgi:hypothetical protein